MEALVREHGFVPCSMLGTFAGPANPYGVEGYKTIAFEVAAQLGSAPDRMCVPTSGGDALYGPYKGFREMQALGLIERIPRMTACQPAGANFIVRALRQGMDRLPVVEPQTFAISIGDPTGSQCILEAIRATDGDAWDSSDEELLATMALLGRYGVCVEGASAAPVAALRRQAAAGRIDPQEQIVAVLTGTGLKWIAQMDAALGPPASLLPDDVAAILMAMRKNSKTFNANACLNPKSMIYYPHSAVNRLGRARHIRYSIMHRSPMEKGMRSLKEGRPGIPDGNRRAALACAALLVVLSLSLAGCGRKGSDPEGDKKGQELNEQGMMRMIQEQTGQRPAPQPGTPGAPSGTGR
jgi:predicted small lipoprotein YifL